MLSNDELTDGMPFVLRLWDGAGLPVHWREVLRGEAARRWYDIYRSSDWEALRTQGPATFRNRVSGGDRALVHAYGGRRVVIDTRAVAAEEIVAGSAQPEASNR